MAKNENQSEHENSSAGPVKRLVRAAIVSVVTGAITYGIRKAVPAIQQKLSSAGDGSGPRLGKAKDAVGGKVGAVTDRVGGGKSTPAPSTPKLSNSQLDDRLKQRAKRRREREKTLTT